MPKGTITRIVSTVALLALVLAGGLVRATPTLADDSGIQPVVTVTQNGSVADVAISVDNPQAHNVSLLDIQALVPDGMSLLEVDGGGASSGNVVGWDNTDMGTDTSMSGFEFKLNTNGLSEPVQVTVNFFSDVNGTATASAKVGAGNATSAVAGEAAVAPAAPAPAAAIPAAFTTVGSADDNSFQPIVTVTRNGDIADVAISVSDAQAHNVNLLDIQASVPDGMSLLEVDGGGASSGNMVGWDTTDMGANTSMSGFEYKIDTHGLSAPVQVTVNYFSDVQGTVSVVAPVGAGTAMSALDE